MKGLKMIKAVIICAVYILLALLGMTLIKYSHSYESKMVFSFLGLRITPLLLMGLFLYGLSFLTFTFFVSKLQISLAVPIISGIYSGLIAVVGFLVFKEAVTVGQAFGIVLVIIGTAIIGIMK